MAVHNLREQLILAGIRELNRDGVQNFSVRRVATECGVSCATPYKHFKDRRSFLEGIVEYIRSLWTERQNRVLERIRGSTRQKIVEVCLEYIRFLVENPYFRSVLLLKDVALSPATGNMTNGEVSLELIEQYRRERSMTDETLSRKTFVVRALLYGTALLFDNGEMAYTEENMGLAASAIDREFDLP